MSVSEKASILNDRRFFGILKKKGGTHMEVQDLITIISTLGFPIAACIWMAYYQSTTMAKLTQVIQENTQFLKELAIKLEVRFKNDSN